MKLRPVSDKGASEAMQVIFRQSKVHLGMSAVPVMLRFLANAPEYLEYLWGKMEDDLQSEAFVALSTKLRSFSLSSVSIIYTPSPHASGYASALNSAQKKELEELTLNLLRLNSIFLLFSLDLREDLKSAFTQTDEARKLTGGTETFSELQKEGGESNSSEVTATRMLAPLFGSSLPEIPKVETFFSIVESEMEKVGKTEAYLKTRVELERVGLMLVPSVPFRMQSNYKVFMQLIEDKYVAYDLLYLLTHVFPSEFPRLLLTSALMQKLLHGEEGLVIR